MATYRKVTCLSILARLVGVLACLLVAPSAAFSKAEDSALSAIDLLAAFSGKSADVYAPFFDYSNESRILNIEIHAVGMENTTARYTSQEIPWHEVNNILRITTADGFEGISGVDTYYQGGFSDEHLRELEDVVKSLEAIQSLDPVEVSSYLDSVQSNINDTVRASIDIALWDLAANRAGKPLHEVLGADRHAMPAYASLPFYASLPEYVEAVNRYAKLGFTSFKFHVWGLIDEDLRLVELIQQTFASTDYRFMVDLESAYAFDDAVRLGEQMDESLFFWFEAPIDDELLEQYRDLRQLLNTQIIPAGYNLYSSEYFENAIEVGAWDAGRFDVTVVGGVTEALRLLTMADAANLTIDVQSWGHSLAQAVNLHVMLANSRSEFFEAPMPKAAFEFGMRNGNLLDGGNAVAPTKPGLGIAVDWERLSSADFYTSSVVEFSAHQH